MEAPRSNFVPGLVLGIGIGLVLGHLTLWRQPSGVAPLSSQRAPAPRMEALLSPPRRLAQNPAGMTLNDLFERTEDEDGGQPLVNAIAVDSSRESTEPRSKRLIPVSQPTTDQEPQTLPFGTAATPLDGNSAKDVQTIRELIELEMPHFTEEQRQVWFESLRDVKKEDVAGILKMWKLVGGPVAGMATSKSETPALPLDPYFEGRRPSPFHDGPVPQSGPRSPHLIAAQKIFRQNLLMANTPGYVPLALTGNLTESTEPDLFPGLTDFGNTQLVSTGFALDLAIDGPGFFQLQNQDGKNYYARSGRFALDSQRRISLQVGRDLLTLTPEVVVPDVDSLTQSVSIQGTGEVLVERQEKAGDTTLSASQIGTIQLIIPLSSTSLANCGNGLFRPAGDDQQTVLTIRGSNRRTSLVRQKTLEMPVVNRHEQRLILEQLQLAEETAAGH